MRDGSTSRMGFTLIEVIITLVLFGIMATMLGPYLVQSVSQSSTPLTNLKTEISLQQNVENVINTFQQTYSANMANFYTWLATNSASNNITSYSYVTPDSGTNTFVPSGSSKLMLLKFKNPNTNETITILMSSTG